MKQIHAILHDETLNRILTVVAFILLIAIVYLGEDNVEKLAFFGTIAAQFIYSLVAYLCLAFMVCALVYLSTKSLALFEYCLAKNILTFIFIVVLIHYGWPMLTQ